MTILLLLAKIERLAAIIIGAGPGTALQIPRVETPVIGAVALDITSDTYSVDYFTAVSTVIIMPIVVSVIVAVIVVPVVLDQKLSLAALVYPYSMSVVVPCAALFALRIR